MIYSNRVDNFYLTPEQLANSPSRADGVDEATERELRHYCCDVVAEAVVLLRLPQVVAATAQVFVQRFYCKRSVKKFDVECVAIAAFWLACKLEEVIEIDNPNRLTLRNVITVMDRIVRRRDGRRLAVMDPYSQKYEELKQKAVRAERHMLRAFGFVLHVEHPHRFVLNYCQMLNCSEAVQQEAWNMANDSLRTTLCVRYRAEVVACAIVFTAARKLQFPMPEHPPWWHLFEVGEEELCDVCTTLCDLYSRPRARHMGSAPTPPGTAALPPGAQSPAPTQATPLRSPASAAPSAGVSLAGQPAASQPPRSDGEAPSVVAQQEGSDKQGEQQEKSSGAAAGEPSTAAANGAAAEPGSDGRQPRPADSGGRARDDGHSAAPRSPSRERDRKRGRSRSRERKRSRSRERDRGSKREKRGDQQLYRPSAGRPPRRDERRREGSHHPRTHVVDTTHAVAVAA